MKWLAKKDWKTYASKFESHWVFHSCGHVPHLSNKLSELRLAVELCASDGETASKLNEHTSSKIESH